MAITRVADLGLIKGVNFMHILRDFHLSVILLGLNVVLMTFDFEVSTWIGKQITVRQCYQ